MIFLFESKPVKVQNEGTRCYLEGVFCPQADVKNLNKRIYKKSILDESVGEFNDKVKSGNAYGTLGHEQSPTVDPSKISHVVQSLTKKNNLWHGRARVIDEGNGKILKSIIGAGGSLGMSTRSTGSTSYDSDQDAHIVNPDLKIHSIDVVESPSNKKGFVKALSEAILLEETAAHRSLTSQQLNDLKVMLASFGKEVEFDRTYGSMQNPHMTETVPQQLERLKKEILQKLLDVQQQIDTQHSPFGESPLGKDPLDVYAKFLSKTSHELKQTHLRGHGANLARKRQNSSRAEI